MKKLGKTDLEVSPICFGGNVFGWTVPPEESFAVLDAFVGAGGNYIDLADSYPFWAEGNSGGESETIVGEWMKARGNRDKIVLATKVGESPTLPGLSEKAVRTNVEGSLVRLQTETIDLLYTHFDDTSVPLEETLGIFNAFVEEGKVRYVGASKHTAPRLQAALDIQASKDLAPYVALQPLYNLMRREVFEGDLQDLCIRENIACMPYFSLASGFLTGKYRGERGTAKGARSQWVTPYLNDRGDAVIAVLDQIASAHDVTLAAVALAWLATRPAVTAPIASARTPEQVAEITAMFVLQLSSEELAALDAVSTPPAS